MNDSSLKSGWKSVNKMEYEPIKSVYDPSSYLATPIWYIEKELPEGAYDWALDIEKNTEGIQKTNRGGYHSSSINMKTVPYFNYIQDIMSFLPCFHYSHLWVNINRKGDYNIKHTHPTSDLACIWYITDNMHKLYLEDPMQFSREALYKRFGMVNYKSINAKAGSFVMFPADVCHWVEPHEEDTPRISVSFNIRFNE